ncbi:MAG: metallophosphoesterase [Planctomycetales bacterium]|nr:metallophosphoesterase [Planctomycetales bacterium]
MPLHLVPTSRRRFLQTTLVGSTAWLASTALDAAESNDQDAWWAFLADPHIAADPMATARGITMFDCLNGIVDEILAARSQPAGVIINGDCAFSKGLAEDYVTLSKALQRLVEAGIDVHMTMGNHDDRGPFYDAFQSQRPSQPLVEGKHVSILKSPNMNLFLVDSLMEVNNVTGEIGQLQLDWLANALDAHRETPAIVLGHHNFQAAAVDPQTRITGLNDSQKLLDVLTARPHVQAYVFGHTHNWNIALGPRDLHLVNLPPCSYVFDPSRPHGWVRVQFGADRLALELRALDPTHAQHGQRHELHYSLAATTP